MKLVGRDGQPYRGAGVQRCLRASSDTWICSLAQAHQADQPFSLKLRRLDRRRRSSSGSAPMNFDHFRPEADDQILRWEHGAVAAAGAGSENP